MLDSPLHEYWAFLVVLKRVAFLKVVAFAFNASGILSTFALKFALVSN
jgi:hypothetical protein